MKKSDPDIKSAMGNLATVGLNMAVGVAVFTFIGYKVDQKRGGGQGFTLVGIFLGLAYGAYEVWKIIRKIDKSDG